MMGVDTGTLFLMTGATGQIGRHAVPLLLERGHRVRALVHREDWRSAALADAGAEVVVGDLLDLETMRAATAGVTAAYFAYPILPGLLEGTAVFMQAASEAGIGAVVNMSQKSARSDAVSNAARQHWLAERVLDRAPFLVTHLRPTFFAEWLSLFTSFTEQEGVLALPMGDGRHAPVAAEDLAHVIAAILTDPEPHDRKVYPLYGPIEMHHDEIAAAMSRALDRPVRYEPITVDSFAEQLRTFGLTEHLIQHLSNVVIDYQNGIFADTNDVIETVGNRKPMTVEEFVKANMADLMHPVET